ncbi:hypothetical protein [Pontibacter populi]|uniref:Uncharacterized protein n=1 Tax=Pontibacter populi TaxID=890055 RepID=A0ABV1RUN0_9BACT
MKYLLTVILIASLYIQSFSQVNPIQIDKSLFDYQEYALKHIKRREFHKGIFEYDSLNSITREFHYEQIDDNFKKSLKSSKLWSVTTFPFFSASDSLSKKFENDQYIYYSVVTQDERINYYLKDLILRFNKNYNQVDRIEGKLIIHASSLSDGDYTYDEIYIADFEKAGDFYLPSEIRFYSIDDTELKRPRIVEKIKYTIR